MSVCLTDHSRDTTRVRYGMIMDYGAEVIEGVGEIGGLHSTR